MENLGLKKVGTPIKRLGIPRRKSLLVNSVTKQAISSALKNSPDDFKSSGVLRSSENTPVKSFTRISINESTPKKVEIPHQAETPKKRLINKNSAPKPLTLPRNENSLEDDIEMWKNGCKEALLALQSLILANDGVKLSCSKLSQELGIWPIVKTHFSDDSEIVPSDDDG